MEEPRPSLILALFTYLGAGWIANELIGEPGWLIGTALAYAARGALNIPLFRDGKSVSVLDTAQSQIDTRLGEIPYKNLRNLAGAAGQLVGMVFLTLMALAVLAQLPGSCSVNEPYESEYRAP